MRTMLKVYALRTEYKENPIGTDVRKPRISWKLQSNERGAVQSAYRIEVARDSIFEQPIWDSGIVQSEQSVHIELERLELTSRQRYYYRVMAWDADSQQSEWSETAYWETGLLDSSEWRASWISAPRSDNPVDAKRSPYLRTSFQATPGIQEARIYATALGLYELELNGQRVGDSCFTPGWTSYQHRLQVQTYDVTDLLHEGDNALGAILGKGWYAGNLGWNDKSAHYGDRLALLLELHIRYEDGRETVIATDDGWKTAGSPILMSELYHGETYDARLELPDWSGAGFDDSEWSPVELVEQDYDVLIAQENDLVRKLEELKPIALITTPLGETVLDMGQNMVGWLRFSVQGEAGTEVVVHHAEVLDQEGNFYTANLRKAKQEIRYVLKGGEKESYEPRFTFQGFRYVRLTGFESAISLDDFAGVVLYTDMAATGQFSCSDPMINQLQHNIEWGLKGNFLDVPTDCPQRDERLGWTGDAQMFIRTAAYLRHIGPFFTKWSRDLAADQKEDGGVPFVIPQAEVDFGDRHSSAAWGDAAIICPWTIYVAYGDKRILSEQYDSMQAWVNYIRKQGDNEFLWNTGFHFGDWLGLDAKPDTYVGATDKDFIATAFYAYCVGLMQKIASILGKEEDAQQYEDWYERIIDAFHQEFVTPAGRLSVPTQTAQVLALMFGLVDGTAKTRTINKLAELLEESKFHLTTGFVGTPYLNLVLSANGMNDAAYKLLLQQDYPSWLYPVTKGATTIWEHWDGIKPDGSFWSADMNSYNHYAYGAIGDWLYRCVAGIDTDDKLAGYKHIHIKPQPGEGLNWVEGLLDTMYGEVRSAWKKLDSGGMELAVTIPANTTADILLPGADLAAALEGSSKLASGPVDGITSAEQVDSGVLVRAGSGKYAFSW